MQRRQEVIFLQLKINQIQFFSFTQVAYGCISGTMMQLSVVDLTSVLKRRKQFIYSIIRYKNLRFDGGTKKQAISSLIFSPAIENKTIIFF
jgi:hypothetical protein